IGPVTQRVDGKLQPSDLAKRYKEANTGSQSVLAKLFGADAAGIEPSYEPTSFTQQNTKRTQQDVPKELAEILDEAGKRPYTLRQNMWQVWGNLSQEAKYAVAGVVDTSNTPTHIENRKGREAKNDGLIAQVDQFEEFM